MPENCIEPETPDITDRIFEIESGPHEYFVDLRVDTPPPREIGADNSRSFSLKKDDKLFLDILTEATKARSLSELYQIIVFSTLGQTSSSNAAIIVPAPSVAGKWRIEEFHGLRLKSTNISFRQKDEIFRRVVEDNDIVNVQEYESESRCVTEYNKFRSLHANLLIPFKVDTDVRFVLLLGPRINSEPYSEKDFNFIRVLHQLIAALYASIEERDQLRATVQSVTENRERIKHLEDTLEKIRREQNRQKYLELIQHQMEFSGVNAYAFYRLDEISGNFILLFNEQKDTLFLRRSSLQIDPESALLAYFSTVHGYGVIENPATSELLASVFDSAFMTSINMFAFVPYFLDAKVCGFLLCLRVDYELFLKNTEIVERLTRNVLQHEFARQSVVYHSGAVDTIAPMMARLFRNISECSRLDIPLGVLRLIVAKREGASLDAAELLKITGGYLAKNEYVFRAGLDAFMIVLPGRKRGYVMKAARIIKRMLSSASYECDMLMYHAETSAQYSALVTKLF